MTSTYDGLRLQFSQSNTDPTKSPWFLELDEIVVAVAVRYLPSEVHKAGAITFETELGSIEVLLMPGTSHTGVDDEERIASRQAVDKLLRTADVTGRGLITDRGFVKEPRVTGTLIARLPYSRPVLTIGFREDVATARLVMDAALGAIRRFLHICAIATENEDIAWASREPLAKHARMLLIGNKELLHHKFFRVHNQGVSKPTADISKDIRYAIDAERRAHPFDQVILWKLRAERAQQLEHDYQAAILFFNTSLEFRFRAMGQALEYDLSRAARPGDESRVRRVLENHNTRDLIETIGSIITATDWVLRLDGSKRPACPPELADYWATAYEIRSGVVHAIAPVTNNEMEVSADAHGRLVKLVNNALAKSALTFPGTALMALGSQGIINITEKPLSAELISAINEVAGLHPSGTWLPPTTA